MPPMYSARLGFTALRQACRSSPITTVTKGAVSKSARVLPLPALAKPSSMGSLNVSFSGFNQMGKKPSAISALTDTALACKLAV